MRSASPSGGPCAEFRSRRLPSQHGRPRSGSSGGVSTPATACRRQPTKVVRGNSATPASPSTASIGMGRIATASHRDSIFRPKTSGRSRPGPAAPSPTRVPTPPGWIGLPGPSKRRTGARTGSLTSRPAPGASMTSPETWPSGLDLAIPTTRDGGSPAVGRSTHLRGSCWFPGQSPGMDRRASRI